MTAGSTVCLQLGSATAIPSNGNSYSKLISAKDAAELASSKTGFAPSSLDQLDVIVDASELSTLYNPMELANWVPLLKTDASVSIQVKNANGGSVDLQPVNTSFLLAGLSSASERREADGSRVLMATRKVAPTINAAPLKKAGFGTAVTLNLDDGDDADMIDEDGLLEDNNDLLAPPPAMNAESAVSGDDCAGRKACDNCTCGRADQEAAGEPKQAPKSSCGKCHLGDAFRCASCPYLGKPAFKPGEEHLVLQLTDDL
mmetsp:Transcript_17382/g.28120  ORF Transcript_17382/g.28120 Transcript_17382/m.28120 type:complete len:258 (-) Transcript_17382:178-951(-)|eukprot:CAMPEP_0178757654 /NCGR_PEP_ID=MMETSP0744-20121128/13937_1 /TAXON_ID=913974 /ORGANISM="Nitzschia punctata, Strain CCMP561" /LENGTH=257 /DNA_ID=CAMNT_0020411905 /DNA_START=61 /DNA_END=834 /DNA_ORIENTATION=+